MGGHDGSGFVTDRGFELIAQNDQFCKKNAFPELSSLSTYGSPMIFVDPYLILSGGYDPVTNEISDESFALNLDSQKWTWETLSNMKETRSFHELIKVCLFVLFLTSHPICLCVCLMSGTSIGKRIQIALLQYELPSQ